MNHVDILQRLGDARGNLDNLITTQIGAPVGKLLRARDQLTWQMHCVCEKHRDIASLDTSATLSQVDAANAQMAAAGSNVPAVLAAHAKLIDAVGELLPAAGADSFVAICTTAGCPNNSSPAGIKHAQAVQWKSDHYEDTGHDPALIIIKPVAP